MNINNNLKPMGAGILPMINYKGMIFFLFAKEQKNNLWSDFGGTSNKNEPFFKTAIREGYEESDGFFGTQIELEDRVNKNFKRSIINSSERYKTFIFEMDYYEANYLINYFNNHRKFIEENELIEYKEGFYEKNELRLFSINDLIKEREIFRPFYREIIDKLILDLNINNPRAIPTRASVSLGSVSASLARGTHEINFTVKIPSARDINF